MAPEMCGAEVSVKARYRLDHGKCLDHAMPCFLPAAVFSQKPVSLCYKTGETAVKMGALPLAVGSAGAGWAHQGCCWWQHVLSLKSTALLYPSSLHSVVFLCLFFFFPPNPD